MAANGNGNGSSVGYENGQPFYPDYYNSSHGLLPTISMDQGNQLIPQQPQSSQPVEDTNRYFSCYSSYQGSQATSGTQFQPSNAMESYLEAFWISPSQDSQPLTYQPVGQSQAMSTGDTYSQRINEEETARRLRKREVDRAYRQRVKDKNQARVDENDQLRRALSASEKEKEELKSNLEALEAEIGRLKLEILPDEQIRMNKLQDEVKRLNTELESEKLKNGSLNQVVETLSTKTAELQKQLELMQQNWRKTTTTSKDVEEITESRPRFLRREWRRLRSLIRTSFFKSRGLIKFLLTKKDKFTRRM